MVKDVYLSMTTSDGRILCTVSRVVGSFTHALKSEFLCIIPGGAVCVNKNV